MVGHGEHVERLNVGYIVFVGENFAIAGESCGVAADVNQRFGGEIFNRLQNVRVAAASGRVENDKAAFRLVFQRGQNRLDVAEERGHVFDIVVAGELLADSVASPVYFYSDKPRLATPASIAVIIPAPEYASIIVFAEAFFAISRTFS